VHTLSCTCSRCICESGGKNSARTHNAVVGAQALGRDAAEQRRKEAPQAAGTAAVASARHTVVQPHVMMHKRRRAAGLRQPPPPSEHVWRRITHPRMQIMTHCSAIKRTCPEAPAPPSRRTRSPGISGCTGLNETAWVAGAMNNPGPGLQKPPHMTLSREKNEAHRGGTYRDPRRPAWRTCPAAQLSTRPVEQERGFCFTARCVARLSDAVKPAPRCQCAPRRGQVQTALGSSLRTRGRFGPHGWLPRRARTCFGSGMPMFGDVCVMTTAIVMKSMSGMVKRQRRRHQHRAWGMSSSGCGCRER
jgi:hypothetical protein